MKITLKAKLENAVRNLDGSVTVYFRQYNDKDIKFWETIERLKEINLAAKDGLKIDIEKWHKRRSLNANDYSWYLQNEIAKVLNRKIDDIHNEMVLQYGVMETYSIKKEIFDSAIRAFEYYKILGESVLNGNTFVHIRVGLGTHTYNSKEMATFIDGIIQEAQDLGIPTKTPNEVASIKSLWGKNE